MKKCFLMGIGLMITAVSFCQSENARIAKKADSQQMFLDVHDLGAGKVSFKDVAAAHKKDLATQAKYGVKFIKFWVDEAQGKVYCLSQAPDSTAIINTHKEAHGLLPSSVEKVKQGQ